MYKLALYSCLLQTCAAYCFRPINVDLDCSEKEESNSKRNKRERTRLIVLALFSFMNETSLLVNAFIGLLSWQLLPCYVEVMLSSL